MWEWPKPRHTLRFARVLVAVPAVKLQTKGRKPGSLDDVSPTAQEDLTVVVTPPGVDLTWMEIDCEQVTLGLGAFFPPTCNMRMQHLSCSAEGSKEKT